MDKRRKRALQRLAARSERVNAPRGAHEGENGRMSPEEMKAAAGKAAQIAPCIACNQACLDHTFQMKISSCLVNPKACFETELKVEPAVNAKRVAVVGAGPAGLATAVSAAERGLPEPKKYEAKGH